MATVPADVQGPSDAELIESVRDGSVDAYGRLYERHVAAAYNLARQLTRSPPRPTTWSSEAFAKVLDTLRAGRGPDSAFRAYLLTALRHTAYDKTRRDRKLELSDDVAAGQGSPTSRWLPSPTRPSPGWSVRWPPARSTQLPERWQAVLWHTEVEGQSAAEVAPILGLTPNGVSALAYRAREGLRQAYLQVHLAETTAERCRATTEKLGSWTRQGLSKRETAQVEAHLDECGRCRALAAELADVNGAMRGFVAPLVLGIGAAGYLRRGRERWSQVDRARGHRCRRRWWRRGRRGRPVRSGPRQFVGVAASATALAAAIAVGLSSGGPSEIPAAAKQPPPPTSTAAPQTPPPVTPKPVVPPPPPAPVTPPAPAAPVPPPVVPPAPANLDATGPAVPVTLTPGGGPADLPITVRNSGGTVSDPVSATLALPPGVHAIPSGPVRLAMEPMLTLGPVAARQQTADPTPCPGGDGTVTCATKKGLQPGQSATLLFRLTADEGSAGGEVTGSISAGMAVAVKVQVRVEVTPPPVVDGVGLDVQAWGSPGLFGRNLATIKITAKNTGTSTGVITTAVSARGLWLSTDAICQPGETLTCTSIRPVEPGKTIELYVYVVSLEVCTDPDWPLHHRGQHDQAVTVTATLGTAQAARTVALDCGWWPIPVPVPVPPHPPLPPTSLPTTTTTPPSTTSTTTPPPGTTSTQQPTATTTVTPPVTSTTTPTVPPQQWPPTPVCPQTGVLERLLGVLAGTCPTPRIR